MSTPPKNNSRKLIKDLQSSNNIIVDGKINPGLILSSYQILGCSLLADFIFRTTINSIEVVKVRITKDLLFCKPKTCKFFGMVDVSECKRCLPKRTTIGALKYLWKKDGRGLFFNGLKDKIGAGLVRSGSFFPIYEYCKNILYFFLVNESLKEHMGMNEKNEKSFMGNLKKTFGPSVVSSLIARTIAMTLCYPMEYRSTVLQGQFGIAKSIDKAKHSKMGTGYYYTIMRDYVQVGTLWSSYELFKEFFKENWLHDPILSAAGASFFGGALSAIVSYPLDLVRTLKITFENEYRAKTGVQILKEVVRESGFRGFYEGIVRFLSFFRDEALGCEAEFWEYCVYHDLCSVEGDMGLEGL